MANTDTVSRPTQSTLDADRRDMLGLVLSGALPLSLFVIANGLAELNGIVPLFFAPFGLPGLVQLFISPACRCLAWPAGWWLIAVAMAGMRDGGWLA